MKKLVILSALALAFTGAAHAKPGGAGGGHGAAGAPDKANSSFGQSTAGTAKAGNMDGKTQSDAAQAAHKKDADNQGKHLGDTKGKHRGDTKGKHKGEKNEMKADDSKK